MGQMDNPSNNREKLRLQEEYKQVIGGMRDVFSSGKTLSYEFRLSQLQGLKKLLDENSEEIVDALHKDMRKPKIEAIFYEVEAAKTQIINAMRDLKKWMEPTKLPRNLIVCSDRGEVKDDPYGLVLIIGAWNYPFLLVLNPLYGAIAGGNCALIKPSEVSPNSAAKIAELIPRYLDHECYKVLLGGVTETKVLLENKFDYIFSTSSPRVGRIVMAAAAKHLTPVTLELGGKSPVYIDDTADLAESAKRILWGKVLNVGQTCLAPDYILCSKNIELALISQFKKLLTLFYDTDDLQSSKDLGRIVNKDHFKRLKTLLIETKGDVVIGGDTDIKDLWISPTFITNVKESDAVMQEEIFGPILPILTCNTSEEALKFITSRPKPLSIYLFTKNKDVMKQFANRSSSGSLAINEVCFQTGYDGLPFGGVGESGMGNYHWHYSYDTFVHKKAVLIRSFNFYSKLIGEIRYPPYDYANFKMKFISVIMPTMRYVNFPTSFSPLLAFGLGMLLFIFLSGSYRQ